jgi:hypothetical protein
MKKLTDYQKSRIEYLATEIVLKGQWNKEFKRAMKEAKASGELTFYLNTDDRLYPFGDRWQSSMAIKRQDRFVILYDTTDVNFFEETRWSIYRFIAEGVCLGYYDTLYDLCFNRATDYTKIEKAIIERATHYTPEL